MTNQRLTEPELDQHLRHTLRAVAAMVDGEPEVAQRTRRPLRRTLVGLGALAVAVPLTAAAIVGVGPEYVDAQPPHNVIVAGSIDGQRYWMVQSFHTDACDQPVPGVETVVADQNIFGQEWDTHGISYGEPRAGGCGYDVSSSLADPSLSYSDGSFVGDTLVEVYAVHPDVTSVLVTVDGSTRNVEVYPLGGAGYALFEVPPGSAQYTVELSIDGHVVPGSRETRTVPER